MTASATTEPLAKWADRVTDETREIERVLSDAGFEKVDVYRYNSAAIRVRVVDSRFEGLGFEERDGMVEPVLERLPEQRRAEILTLLTVAPSEMDAYCDLEGRQGFNRMSFMLLQFDEPSPSSL